MNVESLYMLLLREFGGRLQTTYHLQVPAGGKGRWHNLYRGKAGLKWQFFGEPPQCERGGPDEFLADLRAWQEQHEGIVNLVLAESDPPPWRRT